MLTSLITTILIATLSIVAIHAFPGGAPICTTGSAAPQSLHLQRPNIVTGSIAKGEFLVKFNGVDISNQTSITVVTGADVIVELTSATGLPFKGALLIVSKTAVDVSGKFTLSTAQATDLKISDICPSEGKSGVTHVDRNIKTSVATTMKFDQTYDDLFFDVNVVVVNNDTDSFYYHSQYTFDVVAGATAPAGAPTTGSSKCGIFGLSIFCPLTFCGFFGKLLFGSENC
jgi:hypothetical protein